MPEMLPPSGLSSKRGMAGRRLCRHAHLRVGMPAHVHRHPLSLDPGVRQGSVPGHRRSSATSSHGSGRGEQNSLLKKH
ncbi:hypothetical protein CEXT_604651 [Caerostris extrusa]|uniref:Uncharacterized protein n=1 Tax=Caerostris extrusa TaxID=172846 RepID=A0AAV4URZ2_CAEEX|nr:hypothetical protein CEXT_604651 [Caerostris extrusa]